jgi:hypothetical protein
MATFMIATILVAPGILIARRRLPTTMMRFQQVLGLLFFVVSAMPLVVAEAAPPLEFELEDQFRNLHRSSDYRGDVVLLIGSGRKGAEFNGLWGKAIHEIVAEHPRYDRLSDLPYANLKAVPFFLKGTVRGKFSEESKHWVLMDWKGEIARTYGFDPASSNILVFAPDGSLAMQHSGTDVDETSLDEITQRIRSLLDRLE